LQKKDSLIGQDQGICRWD